MMHKYRLLEAFGLEIHPSHVIDAPALIVEGQPVILIRADLTLDQHEDVLRELLAELPDHVRASHHQ